MAFEEMAQGLPWPPGNCSGQSREILSALLSPRHVKNADSESFSFLVSENNISQGLLIYRQAYLHPRLPSLLQITHTLFFVPKQDVGNYKHKIFLSWSLQDLNEWVLLVFESSPANSPPPTAFI